VSVRIVPSSPGLLASFRECLDVVAREQRFLALLAAPPEEAVRAFATANLANGGVQFFAVDGERVVGWADVMPNDLPTLRHRGALGIGVLPEYRGQGIGPQLLRSVIDAAFASGITRVELEVREDNAEAIRLYEAFGFEHEGRRRAAMRFPDELHDCLAMSLLKDD